MDYWGGGGGGGGGAKGMLAPLSNFLRPIHPILPMFTESPVYLALMLENRAWVRERPPQSF